MIVHPYKWDGTSPCIKCSRGQGLGGLVQATKLKQQPKKYRQKSRSIQILCLIFFILLYAPSRLYLTCKFRHARLNTFFSVQHAQNRKLFHQIKRKVLLNFLPRCIFYLLCFELTFLRMKFLCMKCLRTKGGLV